MKKRLVSACCIIAISLGCNDSASVTASFKTMVHSRIAVAERVVVSEDDSKWYAEQKRFDDVRLDITKSDSIIRPYSGKLDFQTHYRIESAPTRSEAEEKLTTAKYSEAFSGRITVQFAFDSDRKEWIFVSLAINDKIEDWQPGSMPYEIQQAMSSR